MHAIRKENDPSFVTTPINLIHKRFLSFSFTHFSMVEKSSLCKGFTILIQVPVGPLSSEINLDVVGSFKISLIYY
jgi:hypothetical protein